MDNNIIEKLYDTGIVPVIKIDDSEKAVKLAESLIKGGLPVAEITFRTDAAQESIKLINQAFPEMLIGAGTVLTQDQVDLAICAGAKFIVSPGFNEQVVRYCLEKNIPIIPGCATASEIEQALELGLKVVKFFPAEANGGIETIKALSGPYPQMRFMPTGGINMNNMMSYLNNDKIVACGGTWMVKDFYISNSEFQQIEYLTKLTVDKMLALRIEQSHSSKEHEELLSELFDNNNTIISTSNILRLRSRLQDDYILEDSRLKHRSKNIQIIERKL